MPEGERVLAERSAVVPVRLTQAEMVKKAQDLAEYETQLARVETEAKESAADFRSQVKELKKQISSAAKAVKIGKEDREVMVRDVLVDDEVATIVMGTEEVVSSRPPTDEELQKELFK